MKSISDILNSLVQPPEQNSVFGGNSSAWTQTTNPSVGSFSDVLSKLTSQNPPVSSNLSQNTQNNTLTTNANTQNNDSTPLNNTSISITDVQVTENVQANNLNQTNLKSIENTVASLAVSLSQLVQLASHLQYLNTTQAQNALVVASGGAISASQAQQLVTQIENLKNQNSGQNALNLTPQQQNALLSQMLQSMIQNQQIALTQPANSANNQNTSAGEIQGASSLQFNFAGNSNELGANAVENFSIDIQTFNLQGATSESDQSGSLGNPFQDANLTNATTQRITQLLGQLNATASATPTNIQVQSSVAVTPSPELANNFQNLVKIFTQAGVGQAVLNTYLTQQKNDAATNNLQQALNQPQQPSNPSAAQSVAVMPANPAGAASNPPISNNGLNTTSLDQAQLLNDSLGNQNIQMSAENISTPSAQTQPQAPTPSAQTQPQAPTPTANNPVAPNTPVAPTNHQPPSAESAPNTQGIQAPLVNIGSGNSNVITQPQDLVANTVGQNGAIPPIQPHAPTPTVNNPVTPEPGPATITPNTAVGPTNYQPTSAESALSTHGTQVPLVNVGSGNNNVITQPQDLVASTTGQNGAIPQTSQQPQAVFAGANPQASQTTAVNTTGQTQAVQPVPQLAQDALTGVYPQAPQVVGGAPAQSNTPALSTNDQFLQAPVGNTEQNGAIPMNHQPLPATPAVNPLTPNVPIQPQVAQTQAENTAQNVPVPPLNHPQAPVTPVANLQGQTLNPDENTQNPSGDNIGNQVIFTNGELETLNGIVARFNSGVVTNPLANTDVNTLEGNNNSFTNPLGIPVANQVTPPPQNAPMITNVVPTNSANTLLVDQNTQQTNNMTSDNVQNQLVEPTSPTTEQITNTLNVPSQNAFVSTTPNIIANNGVNNTIVSNGAPPNLPGVSNETPTVTAAPVRPVVQQVVTNNQTTVLVSTSTTGNTTPVSTAPVVTQPVTNPVSITSQNVLAATAVGEVVKTAVPTLVATGTSNNNNNPPVVTSVAAVSAAQPVTAQGVSQVSTTADTSTNSNSVGSQTKQSLSNANDLQNLVTSMSSGMATTTGTTNNFQSTVNSVINNNPNGDINSAQILNQIATQVAAQTANAKMVSRLNFQLIPESLGHINVQVALVDQSISARIIVTNPDVHEVLQQHMVDLKAALSQAGLQIDQMQVQVQGGGSNMLAQYYQYQQEGNSYRDSAWTAASTPQGQAVTDDSPVFSPTRSNTLLNLLV